MTSHSSVPKGAEYSDLHFLSLVEKIGADYVSVLKRDIIPQLDIATPLKIRELRVLLSLNDLNGECTSRDIAQDLRYDPATVSRAVKHLIEADYVIASPNEKDTRQLTLTLSDEGRDVVRQALSLFDGLVMRSELNNPDELGQAQRQGMNAALAALLRWVKSLNCS